MEVMKKLYSVSLSMLFFFLATCLALGQRAIIKTARTPIPGIVSFSENSSGLTFNDSVYIDGYVKKYGNDFFVFPVGQNGIYRPFAAGADETSGAYFRQSPSQTDLPVGEPVSNSSKEEIIRSVSDSEYWDINGQNASKITLTWDLSSKIAELTGNDLGLLGIVGWNNLSSRWESIVASIDQTSVFGKQSNLSSGSITTIEALVPDKYSLYALGALNSAPNSSSYRGSLETVSCITIEGWVWDSSYPNADITVELFEGNTVYATGKANIYRDDLKAAGIGTGNYGFSIQTPSALLSDGVTHQLNVRVKGKDFLVGEFPRLLNCAIEGKIDQFDCYSIIGWAWDGNNPASELNIEILDGDEVIISTTANLFREELKTAGYGTGKYGFRIDTPASIKDGKAHQLSVRVKGSNYVLGNSPRSLTCAANAYYGNFELADCNAIGGWVWDKFNPDAVLTVEIMEGSTVLATAEASTYKEYVKTAGYGTGKYGFRIDTPASIKDGKAHQLSVRVKGSNYVLGNSPRSLTCAANARQFASNLEGADAKLGDHVELILAPNPTKDKLSVRFFLEKGAIAELTISDILGNMLLSAKALGYGDNIEQTFDLSRHADGVYIFKLDTRERLEVKRFILLK